MKNLFNLSTSLIVLVFAFFYSLAFSADNPSAIKEEMWMPDAIISTSNLSELPKDILKQPLLKEILTEEFAFYYLDSEDYLSLKGSLKRIAFEHETTLLDDILSSILNTTADLIYWRKENGRLEDYMLSVERSTLLDILTFVAKIATNDSQISQHEIRSEGADKFTIYKLKYGFSELYFTNLANKLVVFTNPKTPLPTTKRLSGWLKDDLHINAETEKSFFSKLFSSDEKIKHNVYFNMNYLTFGYQKYLSSLDILSLFYSEKHGWGTRGLVGGEITQNTFKTKELWRSLPRNPAVCIASPINHKALQELYSKIVPDSKFKIQMDSLKENMAVCWYPSSQFYSPIYVLKTKTKVDTKALQTAFEALIGNEKKAPLESKADKQFSSWSRQINSRYGTFVQKESKGKAFRVKLAHAENTLIFSADYQLVDDSLSVLAKKSPSLDETLPAGEHFASIIFPAKLGGLLKKTIKESLTGSEDALFKEVISKRFLPTLDKMNSMPNLTLEWPKAELGKEKKWEELPWLSFASK